MSFLKVTQRVVDALDVAVEDTKSSWNRLV